MKTKKNRKQKTKNRNLKKNRLQKTRNIAQKQET